MAEETEDPTSTTTLSRHGAIHEIRETGDGSLLEQTISLVDELGKSSLLPIQLDTGETVFVESSKGDGLAVMDPKRFDDYRTEPLFQNGSASLLDLASLIEHVDRFKEGDTLILADNNRSAPSFTAIYDYRNRGVKSFGRHTAAFKPQLSDEWKAWNETNGKALSMTEFARFLEDRIVDVMPPGAVDLTADQAKFVDALGGNRRIADPAKLMELSSGMQVHETGEVSEATRLQSGESQITVKNEHTDATGQQLIVPSMFVIGIPVFKGEPAYQVLVRLRYRKTPQGIVFFYELWRTDRVFDHAFDEARNALATETGVPVLLGKDG